jgi:stress response protein YsnF
MKNKKKNSNVNETTGNKTTSRVDAELEESRNYRMKVNPLKITPSTVVIKPQLKEKVVEKETLSGQTNGIERSQSIHHDNSTVTAVKEVDNNARDSETPAKVIPVVEENFDLTKKTVLHEMKISKRRATKTEKIEVPIMYEEVYVGDKKLQLYDKEEDGILSKIKDTITHGISGSEENDIQYRYPAASSLSSQASKGRSLTDPKDEYNNLHTDGGELVALIEGQQDGNKETEMMVPIWGEEIIISKRKIKLGEVVIRKRRIVENRKINVDIKKEKVSVEYPNGSHKELTPSPSS